MTLKSLKKYIHETETVLNFAFKSKKKKKMSLHKYVKYWNN